MAQRYYIKKNKGPALSNDSTKKSGSYKYRLIHSPLIVKFQNGGMGRGQSDAG